MTFFVTMDDQKCLKPLYQHVDRGARADMKIDVLRLTSPSGRSPKHLVTIEMSQLSTGTVLLALSKVETTAKRTKTGCLHP